MTPKSVKKKLKQPSFAAAVNREELRAGAEDLGVEFDDHLQVVIDALAERSDTLMGSSDGHAAVALAQQEDVMNSDEVKPSEQRGGGTPGEQEAQEKGPWAATAREGVVPAELGGSDAPAEKLAPDPDLSDSVLGSTARSSEPASQEGIDPAGGEHADATTHGGAERPQDAEPDLKDATAGPRQVDRESGQ
jgi:hypothetical protein